ncbi:uncharacterized protein [Chiloscyllium punctatum]|uniref:uncharacterized protein n=1 Tax=Chiloscyllium punctatum TaxID=137246 RepID=UPI003B6391B2
MDKTILLLFITKCVFQSTGCLDCQLATNRSTTSKVLIEWNHFPDGVQAERYLITYGSFSPLFSNFVRSAQGSNIILYDLQQNVNYYFTIKSMRNGKILDHKSFTTCLFGETAITTNVSTTTASFNWRELGTGRHITTISLNFTSYTFSPVVNNYTWNQLKPGTLYNFSLELKQLHHLGLSLTQVFYIMIETASCPPGWVGSLYSCYWIRKDYKRWKDASHFCESAVNRAHLIDINTEEEHKLVSSLLRSLNDFSMLWTGLNDIKTETELQWTDASPYNLSSILWQTLPMNESDCYALQLNPLGPNYLFTGLFCFLPLPYICEYEVLVLPKTVLLKLEDVNENEATIVWDDLEDLFSTRLELFIWFKTITGEKKEYSQSILLNTTKATVPGLHPGQQYYFALMMRDGTGVQSTITPILSVKTRPNPPKNITFGKVSSTALEVLWSPPDESKNASFHHYLVSFMGFGSRSQGTENVKGDKTSLVLGNLKPFHSYKVYVQTVAEGGSLSCAEGPLLASTGKY